MNQALILSKRNDIMDEVDVVPEAFTSDILPQIGCTDFRIVKILPESRPDKLLLAWNWDRLGGDTRCEEFKFSVSETAQGFVNRIKAYLYDLTVMCINL